MQSIINLKWFSSVVIILLIFSLLIPSISYAADADDRAGGTSDAESKAEAEAAAEAAKEAKEAEQAAKDAADVNAAAAISGASSEITATAVSTAGAATPGNVNVNGVSMSKEAAMSAVGAVADATKSGTVSAKSVGVSTEATVKGYAAGSLSTGQVVGATTGYKGSPSEVQSKEAANTTSVSVSSLANAPTALSDVAFDARFAGVPSTPTIDPKTVATVPNLRDALAQAAAAAAAAAKTVNNELGVGSAIAGPTSNPVQDKFDAIGEDALANDDVAISVNTKDLPAAQKQAVQTAFDNFNARTAAAVDGGVNNSQLASDLSNALGDEAASRVSVGVVGKDTEVSVGGASSPSAPTAPSKSPTSPGTPTNTGDNPGNVNADNYSRSISGNATPASPAAPSPDFSFSGKATDAKTAPTPAGGTPTSQNNSTDKSSQVAAQVQTRDNAIERAGASGVTADRNVFSKDNNFTGPGSNFDMPGQPDVEVDNENVVDVPVVNVKDLSDAQARVTGVVNPNLSPTDIKSLAIMLAGELEGRTTTRVAQGRTSPQDIVAAKTQIFSVFNRMGENGKTATENVKTASVVFYTSDGSPKGYAEANYNQNPKAFDQLVKDIAKGVYGIDVPCPNCVDFGAAGPDLTDPHVSIPSGTFTNAGRPQHTSQETAAAIEGYEVNKFQAALTFQERGVTSQSTNVASLVNPPVIGNSASGNVTDGTPTAALPGAGSETGTEENNNSKAGQVVEGQGNSTRNADINQDTKDQLAYAGKVTGTYFVVGSGGNQMSKAEYNAAKGKKSKVGNVYYLNGKAVRVGSTRHDHGIAADGSIKDAATGRTLDFSNPDDRARIGDFITAAVKAGATGVGAAAGYMGTKTVHIGGGASKAWGKGGKAKNAPGWVKEAHAAGLEQAKNFDLAEYNAQQGNDTEVADSEISNETTAGFETSPAAQVALDKVEVAKDKIAEHDAHDHESPETDGTPSEAGVDTPSDNPTTDTDTVSNEDTAASALAGIESLEERISQIEDQLTTKDLTDAQISDLSAELDAATEAIDSFNKAIEEAEAGNTQAGYDTLAAAQDLLNGVNTMTENNEDAVANAPERTTTEEDTDVAAPETEEVAPTFENPIPEPVMEVLRNPIARAVITAAILGTNPVLGIAVAIGVDKLKDLPVVGKIINDLFKFDSNATLSPRNYEGNNNDNSQATSTKAIYTVPVIVTTDLQTGKIDLTVSELIYDYESIEDSEEGEELYYPNNGDNGIPPLVLNEFGEIIYSDGTYAPVFIDGVEYPDPETEYIYISQTIDSSGPLVLTDDSTGLPENFATKFIKNIFGNHGSFTAEDVSTSVRYYVDPDTNVPDDEFYDYVFTLKDTSVRTVAIPVFTSFFLMQERLASVGYEGNVLLLLNQVTDATREKKPNILVRALNVIQDTIQSIRPENELLKVTDLTNGNSSTDNIFDIRDIKEATVYVGIDSGCPAVLGLNHAYIYEVVVYQSSIPNAPADGIIQEVRCGTGEPLVYANEITNHLERVHGFANLNVNEFMTLTTFNFYNPQSDNSPIDLGEIIDSESEVIDPDIAPLPNTTNTISFEVRAINKNSSTIISDWSSADLVINQDTKLDFRWDGNEYSQCLPFLNDNGNYAITVGTSALMTTGNTEMENYEVTEATYPYRIECGGQRNNEFGVDSQTIEITIK